MNSQIGVMRASQPSPQLGTGASRSRGNSRSTTPTRSRANSIRPEPLQIPPPNLDEQDGTRDGVTEQNEDDLGIEAAQSMVGVSIGREQTTLLSPTTPAADKTAALDQHNSWGFFNDVEENEQEETFRRSLYDSVPPPDIEVEQADEESPVSEHNEMASPRFSLPTPWTATPKPFLFVDESKFKDGKRPATRSRAASAASMLSDLNFRRLIPNGLGFALISPRSAKDGSKDVTQDTPYTDGGPYDGPVRSNSVFSRNLPWNGTLSLRGRSRSRSRDPKEPHPQDTIHVPKHRRMISSPLLNYSSSDTNESSSQSPSTLQTPDVTSPPLSGYGSKPMSPRLRRSTSHDSIPHSILSRVSSFGEDGRWDHVDGQVNTRLKAIKDTLSDTLPSLPSINLGAFRPEFTLKRDGQSPRAISTVFTTSRPRSRQNSGGSTAPSTPLRKDFTISRFPTLDDALDNLTGDLVLMGGYRGSILRSAEPPHRQLWVPIKVGLNMRKVDMEVGLEPEDEENMEKTIFPSGMLTHIGPIDISRRLFKRLRSCRNYKEGRLRVHDYGYDWRLSPALLGRKLISFLEGLECNKKGTPSSDRGATVIAHSLGGLITRHVVNQRPELFAGVLYAGTPQHCVNILGPFRNGDEVLLSSKVLTAQVNFTLRTSFALLPESGQCFIDKDTKEQYHVDFFNIESWKKYAFSPCIARSLPALNPPEPQRRNLLGSLSGTLQSFSSPSTANTSTAALPSSPNPPHSNSAQTTHSSNNTSSITSTARAATDLAKTKPPQLLHPTSNTLDIDMHPPSSSSSSTAPQTPAQTSNIPLPHAIAYLTRTLSETLSFKKSLAHNPSHESSNLYPPHAVMYSTSLPTVYGARVQGREGICRADAYSNLVFASGDGVVLARAAMLPRGYKVVEGGRVRTERGHVGMLSDLEAVGRALGAVIRGRREGTGMGGEGLKGLEGEKEGKEGKSEIVLGLGVGYGEGREGEGEKVVSRDFEARGRVRTEEGVNRDRDGRMF
ncbi:hypothetical protein MMC10_009441 [Thelotrema lepadinum]|nr:hypothetical protein [Thelotrema lepadinum]